MPSSSKSIPRIVCFVDAEYEIQWIRRSGEIVATQPIVFGGGEEISSVLRVGDRMYWSTELIKAVANGYPSGETRDVIATDISRGADGRVKIVMTVADALPAFPPNREIKEGDAPPNKP